MATRVSWRRRATGAGTATMILLSLLIGDVATTSATASPAAPPTSDGALHFQPPLNNGGPGDPARADTTLLDSVNVLYCKVSATGCTPIAEANSVVPGVDLLLQTGTVYTTAFSGTLHGVRNGDRMRITVRTAGLSLGSTQLTANILALPSSTQFNPLVPMTVSFRIDRNPVIRARYLHDHGRTATHVAGVLKNEFALDDETAATVLYNDIRVGDVTPAPGRTPYGLQELVEALSAPSTYGDNATRTAKALLGEFPNQDIVNALVASPTTLNVTDVQLLDAMANGLGVTDPQQQLDLFLNICVPDLSCASETDGPPCIPGVTCAPLTLTCDAVRQVQSPTDLAAQEVRRLYPKVADGAKFLSTLTTGCGFDLNNTAQRLELIYFKGGTLSGAQQATEVAKALKGGFAGVLTPDNVVEALAKAGIPVGTGETKSCVAAAGAINGAGFQLLGDDPQNGVLGALGKKESLLDEWWRTGTGNGLDNLGKCLANLNVKIPVPLHKVQVQFTEAKPPTTGKAAPRWFVVGRVGWLPKVNGQIPTLGQVRSVEALKNLPVPNFRGVLNELTTLPALALTGCPWYLDNAGNLCSTAIASDFPIPPDASHLWPTEQCGTHGELCGSVAFQNGGDGFFNMIVPALPGVLNFEASTLVNPNLLGCNLTELVAVQAGALAVPAEIWKRLPDGAKDYLSTGTSQVELNLNAQPSQDVSVIQNTEGHCERAPLGNPHLDAKVAVTSFGNVAEKPGDVGQTKVKVNEATFQGANGEQHDFSMPEVGAISDLTDMLGSGNFFSALAQTSAPITNSTALITLMRTGFLP
jgi:hypothetical protein